MKVQICDFNYSGLKITEKLIYSFQKLLKKLYLKNDAYICEIRCVQRKFSYMKIYEASIYKYFHHR